MTLLKQMITLAAFAGLAACGAQQTETDLSTEAAEADPVSDAAVHPDSGLELTDVTVTQGDTKHVFTTELAVTPQQQAMGLMFRTELGPNEAMIFPREPASTASFWMKNTVIPLDIIFVGSDGRIINIAANTVPYSLDSVTSEGPAAAVLEIPGGRAAELGIEPGALVTW